MKSIFLILVGIVIGALITRRNVNGVNAIISMIKSTYEKIKEKYTKKSS